MKTVSKKAGRRYNPQPSLEIMEPRRFFSAHLVTDINTLPWTPYGPPNAPSPAVQVGGNAYFAQAQGSENVELWKTNGLAAGTGLVKDVMPGYLPSFPASFTALGNKVVFTTHTTSNDELWISDGSEGGTQRIKDINPNGSDGVVAKLIGVGSNVYFLANDGVHGRELWVTDGTEGGTQRLTDLAPGSNSITISAWGTDGSRLYFQTDQQNQSLMDSDGTASGTTRIGTDSITVLSPITAYGGGVAFIDKFGALWTSDGVSNSKVAPSAGLTTATALVNAGGTLFIVGKTTLGTFSTLYRYAGGAVAQVRTDSSVNLSAPTSLAVSGGALYFAASASMGNELYRVSGGATSATLVSDIMPGGANSSPAEMTNVNNVLYFRASDSTGMSLWKVTTPTAGAQKIVTLQPTGSTNMPQGFSALNNLLLFTNYDAATGWEVWKSDGTGPGTMLIKDCCPNTLDSYPVYTTPFLGNVVYRADDGIHGEEPWISDGTAGGTRMIKDINPGSAASGAWRYTVLGSRVYFAATDANGEELWVSDGTDAGTHRVKDINSGSNSSGIDDLVAINGLLYFAANDGIHGVELWRSDGTAAGTYQLGEVRPGTAATNISLITPSPDGSILFTADDGVHGNELWHSDGTQGGTSLLKDINSATTGNANSSPRNFSRLGNLLLFSATDQVHGRELWRTDGTAQGTQLVADIFPGVESSSPANLNYDDPSMIEYHGYLYFSATNYTIGAELFRSDGTPEGTTLVADLMSSDGSRPTFFRIINDRLVFAGKFTSSAADRPDQVWSSDGTAQGTFPLLAPGTMEFINYATAIGGRYFFVGTAAGGLNDEEMWTSDGTVAGTYELDPITTDVSAGVNSVPVPLGDGSMVVLGSDGITGYELWKFDDVWGPSVRGAFKMQAAPAVVFTFGENVSASLSTADLTLRNIDTGQSWPANLISLTYDAVSNQAIFTFPAQPDGRYRATLDAAGVTDLSGNALASGGMFDFTILRGDADQNGKVGFSDLVIVAQNYGSSSTTFARGDFDFDGEVGFSDLVLVAQNYGKDLSTAATVPISAAASLLTSQPPIEKRPIFSTAPVKPKPRPVQPIKKPASARPLQRLG